MNEHEEAARLCTDEGERTDSTEDFSLVPDEARERMKADRAEAESEGFSRPDGESYRPSNGSEGEQFRRRFCARCIHEDLNAEKHCNLHTNALLHYRDHEDFPDEWQWQDDQPTCTAFENENEA